MVLRHLLALELSLWLLGSGWSVAWAQEDADRPGPAAYHAADADGRADARFFDADRGEHDGDHHGRFDRRGHHRFRGRPYRYPPYYHHPHPPAIIGPALPYYPPYYYPYYPPPLYIPSEELYGPGAVQRFMGVDHWFRPKPNVNILVAPKREGAGAGAAGGAAADGANGVGGDANGEGGAAGGAGAGLGPAGGQAPAAAAEPDNIRATNARSLALAWKFIGYGDAQFEEQKYVQANARYRKAARAAPRLGDSYFRQGFALLATGRYDLAADAMKRGLKLDPAWPGSDFTLEELYGPNALAKSGQLDALAKASEEEPNNADLLFLVGVFLHFDGQPGRARPFFQRAAQLAGGNDGHIRAFLQ